jgi:hypothetical protein
MTKVQRQVWLFRWQLNQANPKQAWDWLDTRH